MLCMKKCHLKIRLQTMISNDSYSGYGPALQTDSSFYCSIVGFRGNLSKVYRVWVLGFKAISSGLNQAECACWLMLAHDSIWCFAKRLAERTPIGLLFKDSQKTGLAQHCHWLLSQVITSDITCSESEHSKEDISPCLCDCLMSSSHEVHARSWGSGGDRD